MGNFELLTRSIGKRGIFNTILYVFHEFAFDVLHGTDTKREIPSHDAALQGSAEFCAPQQGSNPWIFGKCVKQLEKFGLNIAEASFLDIGSGKGRGMLLAAFAGFDKVYGVELENNLCLVARRNFDTNASKLKCASYEILNEDAAEFVPVMPLDVVFIYNPFGIIVMRKFLRNLLNVRRASSSHPLYVIYLNPVYAHAFREVGIMPVCEIAGEALIYKIENADNHE
jgi:predicted RNA methylase